MKAPAFVHPPCHCGQPVVRRPTEKPCEWRDRQTCGNPECYRELAARRSTKILGKLGRNHCCVAPGCGNQIERHDGEKLGRWVNRQTCGPACLSKLRSLNIGETNLGRRRRAMATGHPPCEAPDCGNPVEMRDGEKPSQWKRRTTCSTACHYRRRTLTRYGADPAREAKPRQAPKPPATHPMRKHISKPFRKPIVWADSKPAGPAPHFETVAEALARGVQIQRFELPPPMPGPTPVRGKASSYSYGRV